MDFNHQRVNDIFFNKLHNSIFDIWKGGGVMGVGGTCQKAHGGYPSALRMSSVAQFVFCSEFLFWSNIFKTSIFLLTWFKYYLVCDWVISSTGWFEYDVLFCNDFNHYWICIFIIL